MSKQRFCHCGKPAVNAHYSLCIYHNQQRLSVGKKPIKPLARKPIKKKFKKASGEAELFKSIWDSRPHYCEHCGIYLGNVMYSWFFSHRRAKSIAPELRLDPNNLDLWCRLCHDAWGNRGKEAFEARKNINIGKSFE